MKFKTLKHKELPDTYGYIEKLEDYYEILTGDTPTLYPIGSSMEEMAKYWEHLHETTLLEQLKDYDFTEVDVLSRDEFVTIITNVVHYVNTQGGYGAFKDSTAFAEHMYNLYTHLNTGANHEVQSTEA